MKRTWQLMALLFFWGTGLVAGANTLTEAGQLLEQGKSQEAFEMLEPLAPENEGDAPFDFIYGMAALQSGHPAEATFAFERILFSQPDNDRVRLELARAYYLLGNNAAAERQFKQVLAGDPPHNVKKNINLFLAKIEKREQAKLTRLSGFVDQRLGWDSNIRSATDLDVVSIDGIGDVQLPDGSREADDAFAETKAQLKFTHQLSKNNGYFLSLNADLKENLSEDFDYLTGSFRGGPIFKINKRNRIRIPLAYEAFYLDGESFRTLTSIALEWTHARPLSKYNVFANANAIRYPDQSARDVDMVLIGFANQRTPAMDSNFSWFYSLFAASESSKEDGVDHLSRSFYGLKLGGQWKLSNTQSLNTGLTAHSSEYNGTDPLFNTTREDSFMRLSAGWDWQFSKQWTGYVTADITENTSNIELNEYDRTRVFGGVRWRF